MRISLCLLTWNEVSGCQNDVPLLPLDLFAEVFAIDAGSTDGTVEFLDSHGIRVVHQSARSYNAAYRQAIATYHSEAIVFFHPKGTIDPESLGDVVTALEKGSDFVVASRMLPQSVNEEDSKLIRHRKWFGQTLSLASSLRWNRRGIPRLTDPLHGYRGCSRRFTDSLTLHTVGVTADLEMVRHAYLTDSRCLEIAVVERIRGDGGTHFPALSTGRQLLRYLMS
jgi:hypothetical protein